jgi:hypothetical protein
MPIKLEFHENGVLFLASGLVTDEELVKAERGIYTHNYAGKLEYQLCDFTKVTDFQPTSDTMRSIGLWDRKMASELSRQNVAIVARDGSYVRTMGLIWEVWTQDSSTGAQGVLTNMVNAWEEAVKWFDSFGIAIEASS